MLILSPFIHCSTLIIVYVIMVNLYLKTSSCPQNEASWIKRESAFSCKYLEYHCGISVDGKLVEFCNLPMFMEMGYHFPKNICPLFDMVDDVTIVSWNCLKIDGCPLVGYFTNELFRYPACINASVDQNTSTTTISTTSANMKQNRDGTARDYFKKGKDHTAISIVFNFSSERYGTEVTSTVVHALHDDHKKSTLIKENNTEKLITVFIVCGTAVVMDVIIAVYLIVYNMCIERYAESHVTGRFERNLTVTTMQEEEEDWYCVVSELDTLELHPCNCVNSHENKTEVVQRKESKSTTTSELIVINDAENIYGIDIDNNGNDDEGIIDVEGNKDDARSSGMKIAHITKKEHNSLDCEKDDDNCNYNQFKQKEEREKIKSKDVEETEESRSVDKI